MTRTNLSKTYQYTVTANGGSSAYFWSGHGLEGAPNPTIYIRSDDELIITNSDHPSHAIEILDPTSTVIQNITADGVTSLLSNDSLISAGTYTYRCASHPNAMAGSIIVNDHDVDGLPDDGYGTGLLPARGNAISAKKIVTKINEIVTKSDSGTRSFSGGGGGSARFQIYSLSQPGLVKSTSSYGARTSTSYSYTPPVLEVIDVNTGGIFTLKYPDIFATRDNPNIVNFIDGPIDSVFDMFSGPTNTRTTWFSMVAIINLAYGNTSTNTTNPAAYLMLLSSSSSYAEHKPLQFFTDAGLTLNSSNQPDYTAHPVQIMDGSTRTATSLNGYTVLAYKNPDGKLFYIPPLHGGNGNPGNSYYNPHKEFWALMWTQVYQDFITAINILDV